MYRLLIADDEKNIRDGLVDFIDYAQYGVECAGVAADGAQALERIRQGDIDILLTDITMPGMDGIELLKAAAAAKPGLKSIVLSGYDNFTYVREAMRAGASTYLLKPVKRQELTEAMGEVVRQIDREAADLRYRRESMRLLRISLVNRLLMRNIDEPELSDRLRLLEIRVDPAADCRVVVAKLSMDGEFDPRAGDGRLFDAVAVMERFEDRLGALMCLDPLGNITVILPDVGYGARIGALEALRRELEEAVSGRVGMACGRPAEGLVAAGDSYRSALATLDFAYVLGTDHIIDQEEYGALVRDAALPALLDEAEIRRLAQARDEEALRARLDAWFDALQREPASDLRQVRVNLIEFTAVLCEELLPSGDVYAARQSMLRALTQGRFASDLRRTMLDGLAKLFGGGAALQDSSSHFTAEVIGIVEQDYANPHLSIKSIAAKIHVNAAYLGRTFYRDTGKYFSDYLNEYRIGKAKALLSGQRVRIQEIGERVGYVSSSYFAQVFRQQTGVSPSQWRK